MYFKIFPFLEMSKAPIACCQWQTLNSGIQQLLNALTIYWDAVSSIRTPTVPKNTVGRHTFNE